MTRAAAASAPTAPRAAHSLNAARDYHPGMFRARLHAIDHIHVDVPGGAADVMQRFYGDLLGLPLLDRRDAPDVELTFGANRLQMRLVLRERPAVNANRRRLTLEVASLDEVAKLLRESRIEFHRYRGIWFTESRLLLHDPAGHLIELRQVWPM